eukprot:gnl/TRDRNA2_/TRDRNA2_180603_c0_seq1.p1 gnl/TRDRNA2_/TRDRNA2_180603_c0~~gnl/TRDRNA2_/TRDRNA2_180603_c0_seq1.p1  ORF type:complete len:438 (-),score=117.15 gnl/TRDRNA2_/TRDRNA2_180603_c0_seq1:92-1273(-)
MEEGGVAPKHPQQLIFENVSPATRLLEKRRQMYEVQDALENQKARFAKEEEQFRKKEEGLRAKDLQLQHQLFRFNKFLQDNEAKRRRADTRAAEEAAQIRLKEDEIRDLERQLEESKFQCSELEEEVARNMKYEEFLERVKDTCDDYSEIQDLVQRYETLESANRDLMEIQTASEKRIEEQRTELQSYRKEKDMETLSLTNKIATLQSELDEAQKLRQQLDYTADEATQEDSKHSLHFGQILMSVENLYLRCTTKRKNIQHATTPMDDEGKGKDEVEQDDKAEDSYKKKQQTAIRQLRVILAYLKDFKDIVETLKRERKTDAKKSDRNVALEPVKVPEPRFVIEPLEAARGDRGSHGSGSGTNTREVPQGGRGLAAGDSSGVPPGLSAKLPSE